MVHIIGNNISTYYILRSIYIFIRFSILDWLTWVQRWWPRATPDSGVCVMSLLLLQDTPRHDTPLINALLYPSTFSTPKCREIRKTTVYCSTLAGVPVGLLGYPRAYYISFREFNSHRVRILAGTFSFTKKWLAESARAWVSNIRWKSTSSGNAQPYAR